MRTLIAGTFAILTVLLGGSIIFATLRPQSFLSSRALIPVPDPIPADNFGMILYNPDTTPWPEIPFGSLRTAGIALSWRGIHQAPNTFVWSAFDPLIDLAQKRELDVLFTLGGTPRWASANPDAESAFGPGGCAPPASIQYWDEYLRAVVTRAGGRIKFWETWNEPQSPDSTFYCGDVATMVELQRRAFQIIKEIDPGAMVLTPAAVGGYGPGWMAQFLAAGGGKYADIISFHGYLVPGAAEETIIGTIAKFKAVFAKYGQEAKPLWDTEAGWGENSWLPDPNQQAAFLAKFYLLHWSAGVQRFYWYAYNETRWGTLWDNTDGLHRAGIAYGEVFHWLKGATMVTPCTSERTVWKCDLVRENGYRALVLWSSEKAPPSGVQIEVSDDFRQYRDLGGNLHMIVANRVPISTTPVLVESGVRF